MLLSHAHWDHLDLPSLDRLGKELPVVCPQGIGGLLRRKRFHHVVEVEEGEAIAIGGLSSRHVHAEHDGSRGPLGAPAALGFVDRRIAPVYFAGDTDLFDGLAELGACRRRARSRLRLGLEGRPGTSRPGAGRRGGRRLRPKLAIPIHWGTLATLNRQPTREPAARVRALVAERAPDVEVRIVEPGESLELD